MKNIVLGVTGSIAAYKAADIANSLTKDGYNVDVILTASALRFITALTFQTLTKNRAHFDMFDERYPRELEHISLAQKADLALIAPASADIIGKLANGIADDLLSTTVMAMKGVPIYIAPAMNTNMYENPIVSGNMEKLKKFGYEFIEPREAMLACGVVGRGALAETEVVVSAAEKRLGPA